MALCIWGGAKERENGRRSRRGIGGRYIKKCGSCVCTHLHTEKIENQINKCRIGGVADTHTRCWGMIITRFFCSFSLNLIFGRQWSSTERLTWRHRRFTTTSAMNVRTKCAITKTLRSSPYPIFRIFLFLHLSIFLYSSIAALVHPMSAYISIIFIFVFN